LHPNAFGNPLFGLQRWVSWVPSWSSPKLRGRQHREYASRGGDAVGGSIAVYYDVFGRTPMFAGIARLNNKNNTGFTLTGVAP